MMNGRETFFVLFFEIKGRKVTSVEKGARPILRRYQLEKNRKISEGIHDGEKRSLTGKRRSLWMRNPTNAVLLNALWCVRQPNIFHIKSPYSPTPREGVARRVE